MRKKMGLTSIFKIIVDATRSPSSSTTSPPSFPYPPDSPSSWTWPSCKHPRTLSFRIAAGSDHDQDVYKIVNSIHFDTIPSSASEDEEVEERSVTDQIIPTALQEEITKDDDDDDSEECIETVIHGLRSDRFFFEPGGNTSSIVLVESTTTTEEEREAATTEAKALKVLMEEEESVPFKESVAEEMESKNPYLDFRVSMEEMVKAHELNDWDCLEELLGWYLRMNGKKTHVFILSAFVDLLLDLVNSLSSSSSSSPSFCSSASSSSCFCTCSSPTTTTTTSSSSVKFVSKDHQTDDQEVKGDEKENIGSC